MNIEIPNSWEELSDYQQREIIHIISQTDSQDFTDNYIKIVQVLLMKKKGFWTYLKMRRILRDIPISNFAPALEFIWEKPKLYTFPKIKGLQEPAPRLGNLTIKQFSLCDTIFHRYHTEKKEVYLRQLVACLYRLPNQEFDESLIMKPQKSKIFSLMKMDITSTTKIFLKHPLKLTSMFFLSR